MSQAAEDQLALALTDWERLLDVSNDLATSYANCTAFNSLFSTRLVSLPPTVFVTSSTAFFENLERLGKLRARLTKIGMDKVIESTLVAICERLVQLKTASHPALADSHAVQGVAKSELQRLKDLEQWAATRLAIHSSFPDAKCALEHLDRITGYELRQLSPHPVNSDDSTFLKALELGAKIRKGLSGGQHDFIDRIITMKVDALQKSRAMTLSTTSPGGSSSTPPDKAKKKNDDKTTESKEQVIVLERSLRESEATIRTLKRDQQVMAEDKRALVRERDDLALALKTIEDERVGLQESLLQDREAYRSLQSASQEQKSLPLDVEKLKAEISHLSTSSGTSGGTAKVLRELLGKFRGEQIRLEDGIKCISDKLEHAKGAYTALAAENAHMKAELAKSHYNHAQTTISPSVHRAQESGPVPGVQFLMAERARLERELAKANDTLGTIYSFLRSYPMASPTDPNAPGTTGEVDSQRNGVLPQVQEPIRNRDFMNANRPVSEMEATNPTVNTFKTNTNAFSQAPIRDVMDYNGTTNSQGPDAATLAPSTATDTNVWSYGTPERRTPP